MYYSLYETLQTYIYATEILTAEQELVLTLISTLGCLFLIALPFLVVWRIVRVFV